LGLRAETPISPHRENLYIVKTLKEFQYIDEDGKDQGANGEFELFPSQPSKIVV